MNDEKRGFDESQVGEVNGSRGLPPVVTSLFTRLIIVWFVGGQILMLILLNAHLEDGVVKSLVDFISLTIPAISSVTNAKVFNGQIGHQHYALMWLMSFPLLLIVAFLPVDKVALRELKQRSTKALPGSIVFFVLAFSIAALDFNTGFYTFGLAKYSWGFAILSSFLTLILPLAVRYMTLYFHQKKLNEEEATNA